MIHISLIVASPTGQLIKETKTWILRCYACFKTTPQMDRKFCPKCGNKNLKRVSVTLNPDRTQQIHISMRRGIPIRGTKFSLPTPKGGKHAHNPQLTEDQMRSKLARAKTKALEEDFDLIGGNAPFFKHDVTSKLAWGSAITEPTGNTGIPTQLERRLGTGRKREYEIMLLDGNTFIFISLSISTF